MASFLNPPTGLHLATLWARSCAGCPAGLGRVPVLPRDLMRDSTSIRGIALEHPRNGSGADRQRTDADKSILFAHSAVPAHASGLGAAAPPGGLPTGAQFKKSPARARGRRIGLFATRSYRRPTLPTGDPCAGRETKQHIDLHVTSPSSQHRLRRRSVRPPEPFIARLVGAGDVASRRHRQMSKSDPCDMIRINCRTATKRLP